MGPEDGPPAVTEDTWTTLSLPLLEEIARLPPEAVGVRVGALADAVGRDPMAVAREVDRLIAAGYLSGRVRKSMTCGDARPWTAMVDLAERGLRVVGSWPSEDPYEALLATLERRLAAATNEEDRSRLRRVRDGLASMAKDVGSNVLASVIVEASKGLG